MTWLNPWAWVGLLTLAVPVLVHLLARRRAEVRRFPTLRFVPASRLLSIRRSRPTDLLLLAVRCGILAAAVAALARPNFAGDERSSARSEITRAIVVDTSASMRSRVSPTVDTAAAGVELVLESAAVATALRGAVAWLRTQPAPHEIVLFSDMQRTALDTLDLAGVPPHVGLDLRRMDDAFDGAEYGYPLADVTEEGTGAVWRADGESAGLATAQPDGLVVLHAAADSAEARALRTAVLALSGRAPRPVALMLPGYEGTDALLRSARALDEPWMGDVAVDLHRDPLLAGAAAAVDSGAGDAGPPFRTLVRPADGGALVEVAAADVGGAAHLLLLVHGAPAAVETAAVAAAAVRAARSTAGPALAEWEPRVLSGSELARWQRPAVPLPADAAAVARTDSSGRWLWLVALALIALETWLRRREQPVAG